MRIYTNEPTEASRPFASLRATTRTRLAVDYTNEPTEAPRPFAPLRATTRTRLAVDYTNEATECLIFKGFFHVLETNPPRSAVRAGGIDL